MLRQYTLAVGQDGRNLTLPGGPYQIAGIQIDNPTGSWLRILPLQDIYVPPYTLAWKTTLSPAALSVDVVFTDSPSGTPSEQVGAPVTVTLYDAPQGNDPGFASGAQQSQSPIGAGVTSETFALFATEASDSFTLVSVGSGERLVPIRFYGSYESTIVPPPRGMVSIDLFHNLGVVVNVARMSISIQSPTFDFTFTQGFRMPAGADMQAVCASELGSGRHDLAATLLYYIQRGG